MRFSWVTLLATTAVTHALSFSHVPRLQETNQLLKRVTQPSQTTSFDSNIVVAGIGKRQQCSNQNNQGNNSTQVCGNGNEVGNDGDDESVSRSHGLSQSDKIAVGVGVGGGVVTIVGVILTYVQLRNRRRRAQQPTASAPSSELLQPSGSSWYQPQSSYRPFGRSELPD